MYVFLPLCLSCVDAATAAATAVCLWLGSRQRSCLRALVDDSLDLFALPVHVSRSSLVMLCCLRRHAKCVGALPLFQRRIYRCSNRMALRTSDSDEQSDTAGTGILHFLHPPLHSFALFLVRACPEGATCSRCLFPSLSLHRVMNKLLAASKKDDDLMTLPSARGSGVLHSSASHQRLYLHVMVVFGVVAAVCGGAGLLLLSWEYESGNGVADRLGILVPTALADRVHDAFLAAKVTPAAWPTSRRSQCWGSVVHRCCARIVECAWLSLPRGHKVIVTISLLSSRTCKCGKSSGTSPC